MERAKLPKECKPISNTQVMKIINTHYARKANEDVAMGMGHMIENEQGNELRQQTMDYIELFNEFELDEHIRDIQE